jgi:uncharacterized membrane protein
MKFAAVILLAFVAAAVAGPVKIDDNNIGDIVSVGISGSLKLDNKIDQDIVNVIVAALSQQGIVALPGQADAAAAPKFNIPPEMIEKVKRYLAKQ